MVDEGIEAEDASDEVVARLALSSRVPEGTVRNVLSHVSSNDEAKSMLEAAVRERDVSGLEISDEEVEVAADAERNSPRPQESPTRSLGVESAEAISSIRLQDFGLPDDSIVEDLEDSKYFRSSRIDFMEARKYLKASLQGTDEMRIELLALQADVSAAPSESLVRKLEKICNHRLMRYVEDRNRFMDEFSELFDDHYQYFEESEREALGNDSDGSDVREVHDEESLDAHLSTDAMMQLEGALQVEIMRILLKCCPSKQLLHQHLRLPDVMGSKKAEFLKHSWEAILLAIEQSYLVYTAFRAFAKRSKAIFPEDVAPALALCGLPVNEETLDKLFEEQNLEILSDKAHGEDSSDEDDEEMTERGRKISLRRFLTLVKHCDNLSFESARVEF